MNSESPNAKLISGLIRDIPDFPKPGIIFKDITPLLASPVGFNAVIAELYTAIESLNPTKILAIESRGFIFGAPLALKLNCGFIPLRKKGKLPYKTISETYDLEYGTDTLEIHEDALTRTDRVVIIDDLLATGGTAAAVCNLVNKLGSKIIKVQFLIELSFLNGRAKIQEPVDSLLIY